MRPAVPFYGLYDMADVSLMAPGFHETLAEPIIFGAKFSADADPFEQYSPIHRIHPEAPPMMMIHGTR